MSKEWLIPALVAGGFGGWLGARRRDRSPLERVALAAGPLLLLAVIYLYRETALLGTRWVWSACRLAPVLAWRQGWPLYSPIDHGPINGWLYGPVAAVAWLPSALAHSPLPALLIAVTINLLFLLVPLALAARHATRDLPAVAIPAFAAAAAGLLQLYPTWYMASALNVDAVAAGLGAGACLLLARGTRTARDAALAGALVALAAWTKQVEAPLVLAPVAWLGWSGERRALRDFLAGWAVALLAIGAAVFGLMNARDVLFNLWTVPAHHPLVGGWPAAWGELRDLARYTLLLWVPCAGVLLLARRDPVREQSAVAPVWLFLAAALAVLPTGLMAAIKLGGDRNSLHSVYYLLAAALVAVAGDWAHSLRRARELRIAVLLLAAGALTLTALQQVNGYERLTMLPPRCLSQEAWTFAREHPGRAYYPWDPLATLLAEKKFYHFEYGVYDRIHAGEPPAPARLADGLPVAPEMVVYPRADYPHTLLPALPDYRLATTSEDWMIYRAGPKP